MLAIETYEITGLDEALSLLEEVRRVAEPIQRGDQPYSFTQVEVENALATAFALYLYMIDKVNKSALPVHEHRAEILTTAKGYVRVLVYELTLSDKYEVSPLQKKFWKDIAKAVHLLSKSLNIT